MDEVKICPFCGEKITESSNTGLFGWAKLAYFFKFFEECDFHFMSEEDIKIAIKSWNSQSGIWVNVKDKMPPEGERVLVFHDDYVIRIGVAENGELRSVVNKKGYICAVTHWKPMPVGPIAFGPVDMPANIAWSRGINT